MYFTLPVFIDLEPVRRINKQTKGASQMISYLVKMIKSPEGRTLDIAV